MPNRIRRLLKRLSDESDTSLRRKIPRIGIPAVGLSQGSSIVFRIAVIDGQGGCVGSTIIKKVKRAYGEKIEIWALGTNATATSQMLKARANRGASGESAICHCVHQVDVIIGPISILISHALMGEVTPSMVDAIGSSTAMKLLLPLAQEPVAVVGTISEPLPHMVDRLLYEHLNAIVPERKLLGEQSIPDSLDAVC